MHQFVQKVYILNGEKYTKVNNMKRIGILTSGGDAPGMNAVIRSVTRSAIYEGLDVVGIQRGFSGVLEEDFIPLTRRSVGNIVNKGGTILKSSRCLDFKEIEHQKRGYENLVKHGIDALVVVGGDGSMCGAKVLSELGLPTVTIPGTIDKDMNGTDYTIGFDTALNTIIDGVSKIRDTSTAHDRVAIVEVMGRHAGHIAVYAGVACGAEVVLTPEVPMTLEEVKQSLEATTKNGKRNSIIIVAEGAYSAYEVAQYIKTHTEYAPSVTVLGYLQRGGAPSAYDALMAARLGESAVRALLEGKYHHLIGVQCHSIHIVSYDAAEVSEYPLDTSLYRLIRILGQ